MTRKARVVGVYFTSIVERRRQKCDERGGDEPFQRRFGHDPRRHVVNRVLGIRTPNGGIVRGEVRGDDVPRGICNERGGEMT